MDGDRHVWVYVDSRYLNSGPNASVASTLPTEPCLQPSSPLKGLNYIVCMCTCMCWEES